MIVLFTKGLKIMTVKHAVVRQVLINELGLTKETVREEMYVIIREEIQKELQKPEFIHLLSQALLQPKSGIRWNIIELSSQRIAGKILRLFGEFLKEYSGRLSDER